MGRSVCVECGNERGGGDEDCVPCEYYRDGERAGREASALRDSTPSFVSESVRTQRIRQAAFPRTDAVRHIVLNSVDYNQMRLELGGDGGLFDANTKPDDLRMGFLGVLRETSGQFVRTVRVWGSQSIPEGSVGLAAKMPVPVWDGFAEVHDLHDPV